LTDCRKKNLTWWVDCWC